MTRQPRAHWRRSPPSPGDNRTIGVHCSGETILALWSYAERHNLSPSGAAHELLREALGLPPITPS